MQTFLLYVSQNTLGLWPGLSYKKNGKMAKATFCMTISFFIMASLLVCIAIRESSVICERCSLAGVEKSRTSPYHVMGNGMTERFNQTLSNMLGTLEDDKIEDWKSLLPRWYTRTMQQNMIEQAIAHTF